ncbi:hypothetical protein IFM89_027501 [Coptis chinensis]|uniref:Cytochrome P450 n=1 Tax=Coptis chinensis TaxID=261450 RepID=A0A835I7M2_9MAGN|nr:hypothetical protein IFM89_027501 [Coptis chinensis]
MGGMQQNLLVICAVFVISWAWKAFVWVWLKPKKLEKCLREQGIKGPPYNFMSGNYKETMSSRQAARSKPTELSHNIVPRVIPFIHHTIEKYGGNRPAAGLGMSHVEEVPNVCRVFYIMNFN